MSEKSEHKNTKKKELHSANLFLKSLRDSILPFDMVVLQ